MGAFFYLTPMALNGQKHPVENTTPHRAVALCAVWALKHNHHETPEGTVSDGRG